MTGPMNVKFIKKLFKDTRNVYFPHPPTRARTHINTHTHTVYGEVYSSFPSTTLTKNTLTAKVIKLKGNFL